MNALDILKERGFIAQVTFEDELYKAFDEGMVTFYTGFDPTADSLHIGHYIPIMAMAHLQRAGHRPIALMGGGTGMIGDPSGKSDLRRMMTVETVDHNVSCIKKQMAKFLDFDSGRENAALIATTPTGCATSTTSTFCARSARCSPSTACSPPSATSSAWSGD